MLYSSNESEVLCVKKTATVNWSWTAQDFTVGRGQGQSVDIA